MPFSSDGQFYHRQYSDGTWVSICLRCLRPVTSDAAEWSLLDQAQAQHICDPDTLMRLQEKQGALK
jgi:hypothetical protein